MNTASMAPGGKTIGTFTVSNTGSVPLSMEVRTSTTAVSYAASASNATVLGSFTLHLAVVASTTACTVGLSGANHALAAFDTGAGYYTLPVGGSAVGCVELDLGTAAPQSIAGAVVDFSLTATGTQVVS